MTTEKAPTHYFKDNSAGVKLLCSFIQSKHRTERGAHFLRDEYAKAAISSRNYTRVCDIIMPRLNDVYHYGLIKCSKPRMVVEETLVALEEAVLSLQTSSAVDKVTTAPVNVVAIERYIADKRRKEVRRIEARALLLFVKDGVLTTTYTRGICGRYFADTMALQRCSKGLRAAAMSRSGAEDLDQKAACPTIAANILRQNGYESIAAIAAADMLLISKRCRMGYTFGANTNNNNTTGKSIVFPNTPSYDNTSYWSAVKGTMSKMGHVWQTNEELRTLWAREIFHIEADIQTEVESWLTLRGFEVYAHIFDGSIINKALDSTLLNKLNEHIREAFDIPNFQLVSKGTF